jgi:hypothetical protein
LGGALIGGLTGPIGLVIYGASGKIIMTQLGRFVRDNLMPPVVGSIFVRVLEKIAIIPQEGVATTYTFTATKEGFQALIGHPGLSDDDKKFIREWINTLLRMPDHIFCEQQKKQIREVLGIENQLDETFVFNEQDTAETMSP